MNVNDDKNQYFNRLSRCLLESRFDKGVSLVNEFIEQFGQSFEVILFKIKFILKEDFLNCSWFNFKLNDSEQIDDIKGRIYHSARVKYAKCSFKKYNAISGFYADIPTDGPSWRRAISQYDIKLSFLKEKISSFEIAKGNCFDLLRALAKSEEENKVIQKFEQYGEYLYSGLNSLKQYDLAAEEYVYFDFVKTPFPGNLFSFIIFAVISFFALLMIASSIVGLVVKFNTSSFYGPFFQFISILGSGLLTGTVAIYLISSKLFSNNHPFIAVFLMVFTVSICLIGITSAFSEFEAKNEGTDFFLISILISSLFWLFSSFIKMIKNFPHKTNKNKTIIGNYKALKQNDFSINFYFDIAKKQGDIYENE